MQKRRVSEQVRLRAYPESTVTCCGCYYYLSGYVLFRIMSAQVNLKNEL